MSSSERGRAGARCFIQEDDAPAKQRILEEALRLFVRDGLCETSVRDIAAASGYTNPALFKHFRTKAALALHLFEQCYLSLFHALTRAAAGRDFQARQHAVVTKYLEMLDADRDAVVYVQDNLRHFWPQMPERVRRCSIVALVHTLLKHGRVHGIVTAAEPLDLLVAGWMGILQQFARLWLFGQFKGAAVAHASHLEALLTRMVAREGKS